MNISRGIRFGACLATLAMGQMVLGQASVVGEWAPLMSSGSGNWRENLYAIHAIHLPNGKIMMWGYSHQAPQCQLWDPATGAFVQTDPREVNPDGNPFCVGHTFMADGSLFVAGGHVVDYFGQRYAYRYDPFAGPTGTWTSLPLMHYFRWYPSCTTLPDGRILVNSGTQYDASDVYDTVYKVLWADYPEIYDPATNSWSEPEDPLRAHWYPFMFVLPTGKVISAGRYLRNAWPENAYSYTLDLSTMQWTALTDTQPMHGGSAVMYEPGKIMKSGGEDPTRTDGYATDKTAVLDTTVALPKWRETAPMGIKRREHNLVLLPDGKVFAVGGSYVFDQPPTGNVQKQAEMWDPATQLWTPMATMNQVRCYHSTAVLLADGRVLTAGGNLSPTGQIYSPPYLFKGPRPVIESISLNRLRPAQFFNIQTPNASSVAKVVLMGLNAVTHAFDQNQRRVPLTHFVTASNKLLVLGPASYNVTPPGYYMLFVVNALGVPSVAQYVRIMPALKKIGPGG